MADALAALPEADREVVTLTYWDGLTSEQVAAVIGARPATVRKRLQRAREQLARRLEVTDADESEGTLRPGSLPARAGVGTN